VFSIKKCIICGQVLRKIGYVTWFCPDCCFEFQRGNIFRITEEGERERVTVEELFADKKEKAV
jgi:predicted amidophosphoribosyltransferase